MGLDRLSDRLLALSVRAGTGQGQGRARAGPWQDASPGPYRPSDRSQGASRRGTQARIARPGIQGPEPPELLSTVLLLLLLLVLLLLLLLLLLTEKWKGMSRSIRVNGNKLEMHHF